MIFSKMSSKGFHSQNFREYSCFPDIQGYTEPSYHIIYPHTYKEQVIVIQIDDKLFPRNTYNFYIIIKHKISTPRNKRHLINLISKQHTLFHNITKMCTHKSPSLLTKNYFLKKKNQWTIDLIVYFLKVLAQVFTMCKEIVLII